jgi:DNA-directed RNA polymerase subunit RPC12/RpoP
MIAITKVETIDTAVYNNIHCPQCNKKLGYKPVSSKVSIFRLSQKTGGKLGALGLTCSRCKSNYLLMSADD